MSSQFIQVSPVPGRLTFENIEEQHNNKRNDLAKNNSPILQFIKNNSFSFYSLFLGIEVIILGSVIYFVSEMVAI